MNATQIIVSVCLTIVSYTAFAERVPDDNERHLLPDAANGPASSNVETPRAYAEIQAGKDSSTVSLKLSRSAAVNPIEWGGKNLAKTRTHAWTLTLSAPVNKKDDDTDVADLDGLSNAVSLAVKWTGFSYWRRLPTITEEDDFCERIAVIQAQNTVDVSDDADADARVILKKTADEFAEKCKGGFDSEKAFAVGPNWGLEHDGLYWPDKLRWVYGVESKIGTEEFKYTDSASFSEKKDSKTPWSMSGFIGIAKPVLGLIYVGYRFDNSFKNQDKVTICNPIDNSPALSCTTNPLGAPADNNKSVAFVAYRRQLGSFAVSPRVSHDFDSDVTGIDVPVYFWKDKDGNLIGGLKAGWRSDSGGIDVSVFVGATFTLFD